MSGALRLSIAIGVGLVAILGCSGLGARPRTEEPVRPISDAHQAHPRGSTAADNGYLAHLPPGYGDGVPRPLLVFWHGVGENGDGRDELGRVLENGPPRLVHDGTWPDLGWVVLSPQHHDRGCPTSGEIHRFFEYAVSAYDVDPDRVYLTGLSCGAIGGWNYLGDHLDTHVAAAVLVAGNGKRAVRTAGCRLSAVPIWAFHGDADGTVPPDGSTAPMEALADCPHPERRALTIYEGVAHDSWTRTYDGSAGHDVYAWLSRFRRAR